MKLKALVAALAVAAILPVAALADEASPSDKANGARSCQALKTSLGAATFASTYGTNADKSNAFGKCVSKWTQAEHQNRHAAAAACTAEQADANFAAVPRRQDVRPVLRHRQEGRQRHEPVHPVEARRGVRRRQAGGRECGPRVQGGAEGDGRRAVQGQVRHDATSRTRSASASRSSAAAKRASDARPGGALRRSDARFPSDRVTQTGDASYPTGEGVAPRFWRS